jgi:RNA polymerase sigma factor (TIGR02999 family)
MRRILINYARSRNTVKRGSGQRPEAVNVLDLAQEQDPEQILALDEAIQQLRASDPLLGELVHLRFFAGLSVEETGKALGLSRRTVIRHWNFARAWLARALRQDDASR